MSASSVDELAEQLQLLTIREKLPLPSAREKLPPPLDRIPVEVRVQVFKLVLCHEEVLVREAFDPSYHIDTALLAALTKDAKFFEAFEVFYARNTFRFPENMPNMWRMSPSYALLDPSHHPAWHVKHLELANFANASHFLHASILGPMLHVCTQWPMLSTVTFAYDCLDTFTTLRSHLATVEPALLPPDLLTCVAVGHYMARYSDNLTLDFKDIGLIRSWHATKTSKPNSWAYVVDALKDALQPFFGAVFDFGECMKVIQQFVTDLSLADWVAVFDRYMYASGMGADALQGAGGDPFGGIILRVFSAEFRIETTTYRLGKCMGEGVSFRELDDQLPEVLEAVGDLININARHGFRKLKTGNAWYERVRAAQISRMNDHFGPSSFPQLEEVKAAIPAEGVAVGHLVNSFRSRIRGRADEFIAMVKQIAIQDAGSGKILLRKTEPQRNSQPQPQPPELPSASQSQTLDHYLGQSQTYSMPLMAGWKRSRTDSEDE